MKNRFHHSKRKSSIMAKFYVQSGTLKAIVDSADPQRAALWAIHQAMQQIAPIDDESAPQSLRANPQCLPPSSPTNFISLGDTIILSEIGFGHEDHVTVDTFEAFREWHSLWHALEKLESLM
jgi:hypothetical protein